MTLFIVLTYTGCFNQAVWKRNKLINKRKEDKNMNKRYLVLLVTGATFATILAGGCAARKRVTVTTLPITSSAASVQLTTTRPSMTEATVIKNGVVYREATKATTAQETETKATVAAAKPTTKPTAKPTKKPTAKPTKKPTAKPAVKANTLAATPKTNANAQEAYKISGIYNGSWSQVTVDATDNNMVKITVTINDQDGSNKASVWKMSGKYNPSNGTLIYNNCSKTNFQYDENGNVASKSVAYSNGQGMVTINNGMVTWSDYQEHAADDMTFISASQHDHRG